MIGIDYSVIDVIFSPLSPFQHLPDPIWTKSDTSLTRWVLPLHTVMWVINVDCNSPHFWKSQNCNYNSMCFTLHGERWNQKMKLAQHRQNLDTLSQLGSNLCGFTYKFQWTWVSESRIYIWTALLLFWTFVFLAIYPYLSGQVWFSRLT